MLLRLLLVVILAVIAPAAPAAACHDRAPVAMMHGPADHHSRDLPAQAEHLCVGCTAVADWNGARVAPPLALPAPKPSACIAILLLLPAQAPTPPPPRMA